jgi:hypothetical protein
MTADEGASGSGMLSPDTGFDSTSEFSQAPVGRSLTRPALRITMSIVFRGENAMANLNPAI